MSYRSLDLDTLEVNRSNDRHGELENETAAIAWLFNHKEQHMKKLARDLVESKGIYEAPLVYKDGSKYIVFDGNRRVTCLKLLDRPSKAPNKELQDYFRKLRSEWKGAFVNKITCQVESDRDKIDEILFRRHTGSQSGVGQSRWDDRMKANFINRTGKGTSTNVAEEVEDRLAEAGLKLSVRKLPRSTMNRLLSSEAFRNRVGFSLSKRAFIYTHDHVKVLNALKRISEDLGSKKIVLSDVWDVEGKSKYLDSLELEGILPNASDRLKGGGSSKSSASKASAKTTASQTHSPPKLNDRENLIPQVDYGIAWPGRLQRHRSIWEELQFSLLLNEHPNAISVLFRVLVELSIDNYLKKFPAIAHPNDKLGMKLIKTAEDMVKNKKIDNKYVVELKKLQHSEHIISTDTLHKYVHSPTMQPSPQHLTALWDTLAEFTVACLNA